MATVLNQPKVLSQPFAENGDKNTIPVTNDGTTGEASQSLGFPAVCSQPVPPNGNGIPPSRADFNGIFNLLSGQFFYLQNGGKFTFNQDVSDAIGGYPQGAVLTYTNNNISYEVVSLIANNTYNFVTNPEYIDGVKWKRAFSDNFDGAASTILTTNLTKNRALISNGNGKVAVANTTSTELNYLHGVTSAVQTQLNNRLRYPDYTARVFKNPNTNYTAEFSGLLYIHGESGNGTYSVTINGVSFIYCYHGGSGYSAGEVTFPIEKGDTFNVQRPDGSIYIFLIPEKQ